MSLGRAPANESMFGSTTELCETYLSPTSVFGLLHRECHRLFPDDAFADLYSRRGRPSVSPRVLAVVMVLQRIEGLSDREAVEHFTFDARWKYATGGLAMEFPGFVHTVLVDMRARLRASARPNRIFEAVLDVAKRAGLVGRRRVLDSTPLYDAVATQDTVTMVRSAIVGLLATSCAELRDELRPLLRREDDYARSGKPICDWDDVAARESLVDALTRDALALLAHVHDRALGAEELKAAALLATVVGQDIEPTQDGRFRIVRGVAPDRVISTVDPDARHGHKTSARGFDGYKGHVAIDPDSELIVATAVTPGNAPDGSVAETLLADVIPSSGPRTNAAGAADSAEPTRADVPPHPRSDTSAIASMNETAEVSREVVAASPNNDAEVSTTSTNAPTQKLEVYGDTSYGLAPLIEKVEAAGGDALLKVPTCHGVEGRFSKDHFEIDLDARTVRCPAEKLVQIRMRKDGSGTASFGPHCTACSQRAACTKTKRGRVVTIHPHERTLASERRKQRDPAWKKRYRATRPKVERKLAHMMLRRHGGRRARVRGRARVAADFALLGAAINIKRLAAGGVTLSRAGM